MQIGNFHIGPADKVKEPTITAGEVYLLWDNLVIRYDLVELMQIYQNFAHDPDFKNLLEGDIQVWEKQINRIEQVMNKYKLPMPDRYPKSASFTAESGIVKDQLLFRRVFTTAQDILELCIRSLRAFVVNDELRNMFADFFEKKLHVYDELCMYGKVKGWLAIPPMMNNNQQS